VNRHPARQENLDRHAQTEASLEAFEEGLQTLRQGRIGVQKDVCGHPSGLLAQLGLKKIPQTRQAGQPAPAQHILRGKALIRVRQKIPLARRHQSGRTQG
jgi:hypothetical protein